MSQDLKPCCYICGEGIYANLALLSLTKVTDRVFLVHQRCIKPPLDNPYILQVERKKHV
jgi:hypothetical protein